MRIVPQREIICYPITNVTKPIDLFAPFPKQTQSFVPINAPEPPSRISSKQNSTLKVLSQVIGSTGDRAQATVNSGTITLRKSRVPTSIRSRSAGSLTTSFSSLKDEKNFANHSRIARQYIQRVNSLSPVGRKIEKRKSSASPIAFGRSISKERMFAEEKKKMEEQLPLCRKSWTASTNILRNPFLKSPKEVKDAVRCTYTSPAARENFSASHSTRKLQSGGTIKTSTVTHTTNKLLKNAVKKDEKSVQMTVKTTPSTSGAVKPAFVKSNLTKSTRSTETKYSPKTKQITKTLSNVSLARTSSTYSIDSTNSKRRKPQTIKSKAIAPPTISSKSRKKKSSDTKNGSKPKATSLKEAKHHAEVINFGPNRGESGRSQQKAAINEAIRRGDHSVRSNSFFQQLFLGEAAANAAANSGSASLPVDTAVATKAHFFDTFSRRASDPKRKSQNVYLVQKRAVTGSKFKRLETECLRKSRSLSPRRPVYYDHLSKFDSYYQLSSEEEEFGCTSLNYCFEARSNSEPRPPVTYVHKIEKEKEERPFTPTREIRSPSSRRIQSFRSQSKSEKKSQEENTASRRYHSLDSRLRSIDTADSQYEHHLDRCAHRPSDKFRDLNRFYSTVERVGQLERATSSTDLHPIRKEGELIDFDVWKQVRNYERAEKELNCLVGKLKEDEREKDFLFRPKYVEEVKWNQRLDRGLRVKDKSVEDLKDLFREKSIPRDGDHEKIDAAKDTYKPLWRGSSVIDVATSMTNKYNPSSPTPVKRHQSLREAQERRYGISRNLISTLSKDQVNKIKSQLCEIYSNNGKGPPKRADVPDNYVINVTEESNLRPSSLVVRSHSLIGQKEILVRPVLLKQRDRLPSAAESQGKAERLPASPTYTEDEKKKLLQQLGQEIRDKLNERRQSVLQPRETRGAIAAKQISLTQSPTAVTSSKDIKAAANSLQAKLTSAAKTEAKYNRKSNEPIEQEFGKSAASGESSDNLSSDASKQTVIITDAADKVKEKIHYFERKRTEEPAKTIYVARDDSSPDEDEVIRLVDEKVRARRAATAATSATSTPVRGRNLVAAAHSTSVSDFKEIFGESESNRNLIEFRTPSPDTDESESNANVITTTTTAIHSKNVSDATSTESFFRSRSISPIQDSKQSVRKQPARHSITDGSASYRPPRSPSTLFVVPPRRFKSDPDIIESVRRNNSPGKTIIKNHEAGDVAWITHKFESRHSAATNDRSRSRSRKVSSPIPRISFKKDDRFMPHIDVISKTAALKQEIRRKSTPTRLPGSVWTGEVEKIRSKFETAAERLSLIGQMYTSSPDIRELKDASGYLSGSWIAHQYPKPNDNSRASNAPDAEPTSTEVKRKPKISSRSNSTSPPRSKEVSSILKPFYDIFADQDYDPKKHRPIARYIPDKRRIEAEFLWRRLKSANGYATLPLRNWKHSVKFQGWNMSSRSLSVLRTVHQIHLQFESNQFIKLTSQLHCSSSAERTLFFF